MLPGRFSRQWLVCVAIVCAALTAGATPSLKGETPSAADAGPLVSLRIGPHAFRIPRNYFLHPPHHSGVDVAFGLRALMPDMAPESDANRQVFRMSPSTEEGGRVVRILFEVMPDRPRDDARWRLGNVLRSYGAAMEDFAPPSDASHGLYTYTGPQIGNLKERRNDLYWGELPVTQQFVALSCESRSSFRVQYCNLWIDWQGRTVQVGFVRRNLGQWREIAAAGFGLMEQFAVRNEGARTNASER